MKYTLLELTQAVLSSMDSDEVSSINDTVESQQVVEVIKSVYDDIISRSDLKSNSTLFNLLPSNDVTKPTLMQKPTGIDKIEWIKYNCLDSGDTTPNWQYMQYATPEQFLEMMHSQDVSGTNYGTFTHTFDGGYNIVFTYRNDIRPSWYTSFDDDLIFFDTYDSDVDTTLQAVKTLGYGTKISDFVKSDSYVPKLHPQQFSLLLNEAKSLAWAELKQTIHAKAEATARKGWVHLQKTRVQIPDPNNFNGGSHNFDRLPNFARPR
jgi:hypothetical protein